MTKDNNDPSISAKDPQPIVSIPIHQTAIYTYKDAAVLSKCSYVIIWRAVANGKLKVTAIGNQPRIIRVELLKWIEDDGATGRSMATI